MALAAEDSRGLAVSAEEDSVVSLAEAAVSPLVGLVDSAAADCVVGLVDSAEEDSVASLVEAKVNPAV